MKAYEHSRIIQLMPADGWFVAYAQDDGTYERRRTVGFALCEGWSSRDIDATHPSDEDRYVYRVIYPVTTCEGLTEADESNNIVAVVHEKDWEYEQAHVAVLAREHAERQARSKV